MSIPLRKYMPVVILALSFPFLAFALTFTTIDIPGGSTASEAVGINARGQIVGDYFNSGGTHGFFLSQGKFSTIDLPGARGTAAAGISASQEIVGTYLDGALRSR